MVCRASSSCLQKGHHDPRKNDRTSRSAGEKIGRRNAPTVVVGELERRCRTADGRNAVEDAGFPQILGRPLHDDLPFGRNARLPPWRGSPPVFLPMTWSAPKRWALVNLSDIPQVKPRMSGTIAFCRILRKLRASPSRHSDVRFGSNSEVTASPRHVRFSNRPIGVKRFQTIHQHSVDVARGLALLFGIGTRALPSWDSRTRRNNLYRGLAVLQTAGPSGHANSPQPSSRKGHHSTVRWSSSVLLSCLICVALMLLRFPGSIGTRCRQPRCGA